MQIVSGSRLGPYEVVTRIGAGGMGDVFRAMDTRLGRTVAIKVLAPHLTSDPNLRERFDREARSISSLSHPHICALFDIGHENEIDYLVMEYLEGENLADRLARGPLPLAEVFLYGAQLADALAVAHGKGIVHRDLKPANVMLTKSGLKLLDFGLARTATPVVILSDAATEHHERPLTAAGTILGTFQYMAPEQLEGLESDERTDIFALGAVLYEMATGQRAFEGKTKTSLIAAIVGGQPRRIDELQPLVPRGLAHVIERCLKKDSNERWRSAHDVAEELRWLDQRESSETPSAPDRTRSWWHLLAGASALAIAMLIGYFVHGHAVAEHDESSIVSIILPPKGVEIDPTGEDDSVVISPNGRMLAFTGADSNGRKMLWLRAIDELEAHPLQATDGARFPFWSADGTAIAFFARDKLKRVALDGSPPVTICDVASNPLSGDWSADGTILFSPASGSPIHRVRAEGGPSSPVTQLDVKGGETTHRWARFLPGGKGFLYLAGSHQVPDSSEINAIYAARTDSSERKLIMHTRSAVVYAAGYLLFVRDNKLLAQRFDTERLELEGQPVTLAADVHYSSQSFFSAFSVSGTDRLVYATADAKKKLQIEWLNRAGTTSSVAAEAADYGSWDVSPDGQQIVFTITDPTEGEDIWLRDLERGTSRRLTVGGTGSKPVFSPDGRRIAFQGKNFQMLLRSVDEGSDGEIVWSPGHWSGPTAWSPDGRYLAVWSFDPKTKSGYNAFLLPLFGGRKPTPFANTAASEFPSLFSPDSRYLLYESDETGRNEVYAVSIPDLRRKQQISSGGGSQGVWAGPHEVWFRQPKGQYVSVFVTPNEDDSLSVSTARTLFKDQELFGLQPVGAGRILAGREMGEDEPVHVVLVDGWKRLLDSPKH